MESALGRDRAAERDVEDGRSWSGEADENQRLAKLLMPPPDVSGLQSVESNALPGYMLPIGTADRLRERPPAGSPPCSRNAGRKR